MFLGCGPKRSCFKESKNHSHGNQSQAEAADPPPSPAPAPAQHEGHQVADPSTKTGVIGVTTSQSMDNRIPTPQQRPAPPPPNAPASAESSSDATGISPCNSGALHALVFFSTVVVGVYDI